MPLPLESVPNVSEGRDEAVLRELREAMSAPARLLDVHTDWDHHRSVFTLVGSGEELVEALLAGIRCAWGRLDLRRHEGAHPRIGAADVVPLVPLEPAAEPAARDAALALADRVAAELELPVFFYGRLTEDSREPAYFRRGGPEELQRRLDAVGLDLPRAGLVQVSMNVTDWEAAALHEIVSRIVAEAEARGVPVAGSELVGLMPAGAAVEAAGSVLGIEGFDPMRVLELRLLDP